MPEQKHQDNINPVEVLNEVLEDDPMPELEPFDPDSEHNPANYGERLKLENFVMPEDADLVSFTATWEEALLYANPEDNITKEEAEAIGLDVEVK